MREQAQLTSGLFDNTPLEGEIAHERKAIERGYKRLMKAARDAVDRGRGGKLRPAERIAGFWFNDLHKAVLATTRGDTPQHRDFARVAKVVGSRRMVALTLMELMSAAMKYKVMIASRYLVSRLAQALQAEANHRTLTDVYRREAKVLDDADARRKVKRKMLSILTVRDRGTINKIARRHAAKHTEDEWWCIRKRLMGAAHVLIELATSAAMIEVGGQRRLAFRRGLQHTGKGRAVRRCWYIYFDDDLIRKLSHDIHSRASLRPLCPVMLVPPFPWADDRAGGYALIRKPMIARSNKTIKAWQAKHDMSAPMRRLNLMSQCRWTTNGKNYEVYQRLRAECPDLFLGRWADKDATAWECAVPSVPPDTDPPRPPHPEWHKYADDKEAKAWYRSDAGKAWRDSEPGRAWRREMAIWRDSGNKAGSARFGFVARLNEVKTLIGVEQFWMPHHFDFRGRAQPMSTYVTHHGDDFMRGLLLFAEAKPIVTDSGRSEFAKHCANMWGKGWDKDDQPKQATFLDEFGTMMREIAADPVQDRRWFSADEPWQFLACCFAVADPDIAARLPRQRDATCNGLQHAAALVRDPVGALASNLVYTGQRQSAYTRTAENLRAILEADPHPAASELLPVVDDKLCKAPFMTDYYGSTMMGKAKQIYNHLRKIGWNDTRAWRVRKHARVAMQQAIDGVCPHGRSARDWFAQVASIVANGTEEHKGECLRWHIDGWLPVVQTYRRDANERITLIGHMFRASGYSDASPVDIQDQVRGAAPNIVHWIDGQHAMMVHERCAEAGITLATVFDSYWTHCETGEEMLFHILDTFYELHSEPILDLLYEFWVKEYPWATIPPPPSRGVFDIAHVLHAKDAFR